MIFPTFPEMHQRRMIYASCWILLLTFTVIQLTWWSHYIYCEFPALDVNHSVSFRYGIQPSQLDGLQRPHSPLPSVDLLSNENLLVTSLGQRLVVQAHIYPSRHHVTRREVSPSSQAVIRRRVLPGQHALTQTDVSLSQHPVTQGEVSPSQHLATRSLISKETHAPNTTKTRPSTTNVSPNRNPAGLWNSTTVNNNNGTGSLKPKKKTIYLRTYGRMGNVLFECAAVYMIAKHANRKYKVLTDPLYQEIFPHFNFNIIKWKDYPPKLLLIREKAYAKFDPNFFEPLPDKDIGIIYFFQSFKYFQGQEATVRRMFRMNDQLMSQAATFIKNMTAARLKRQNVFFRNMSKPVDKTTRNFTVTVVGIHIRLGDLFNNHNEQQGHIVPSDKYMNKAMNYFRNKFKVVQFIICSDNITLVKENLTGPDIAYSSGESWALDSAILQQCDHLIVTVGTFGWWSAFLGEEGTRRKDIVYLDKPYKPNSYVARGANLADYFPPHWIPMSDK